MGTWDGGATRTAIGEGCAGGLVVSVVSGSVGALKVVAGEGCAVCAKPGWAAYPAARKQKHKAIRTARCTQPRARDFACLARRMGGSHVLLRHSCNVGPPTIA
jgi:hypothetical protein